MVYAQPRIRSGELDAQTSLGFWDTNEWPNLGQMTRPSDTQQQKNRTCRIVDFVIPADHRVKIKENKKRDKYQYLARELKKHKGDGDTYCGWSTWHNPQRIGKGTRRLGNKRTSTDHPDYSIIKTGQNTEKTWCHSNSSEKPPANVDMKNSQRSKIIIIKSKRQHYREWLEYLEESWRLEETCCHSISSEKPSA